MGKGTITKKETSHKVEEEISVEGKLNNLQLHETIEMKTKGKPIGLTYLVTRVPHGWLYQYRNSSMKVITETFVSQYI